MSKLDSVLSSYQNSSSETTSPTLQALNTESSLDKTLGANKRQAVTGWQRFAIKNFGGSKDETKSYLRSKGYEVVDDVNAPDELLVRKANSEEPYGVIDPEGFDAQDVSDFLGEGAIDTAGYVGGAATGGLPGLFLGGAGASYAKSAIGQVAGIRGKPGVMENVVNPAASGALNVVPFEKLPGVKQLGTAAKSLFTKIAARQTAGQTISKEMVEAAIKDAGLSANEAQAVRELLEGNLFQAGSKATNTVADALEAVSSDQAKELLAQLRQSNLLDVPMSDELAERIVATVTDPKDKQIVKNLLLFKNSNPFKPGSGTPNSVREGLDAVKRTKDNLATEIADMRVIPPEGAPEVAGISGKPLEERVKVFVQNLKKNVQQKKGAQVDAAKESVAKEAGLDSASAIDVSPIREKLKESLVKADVLNVDGTPNTKKRLKDVAASDIPKLMELYEVLEKDVVTFGDLERFRGLLGEYLPSPDRPFDIRAGLGHRATNIISNLYGQVKQMQEELVPGLSEITTKARNSMKAEKAIGRKVLRPNIEESIAKKGLTEFDLQNLRMLDESLGTNFVEQARAALASDMPELITFNQAKKLVEPEVAQYYDAVKPAATKARNFVEKIVTDSKTVIDPVKRNLEKATLDKQEQLGAFFGNALTRYPIAESNRLLPGAVTSDLWKQFLQSKLTGEEE